MCIPSFPITPNYFQFTGTEIAYVTLSWSFQWMANI